MIVLIGAGGHAKVVLDALLARGTRLEEIAVRDGDPGRAGSKLLGVPVEGPETDESLAGIPVHVAVGSCQARERLYGDLTAIRAVPHTILHPAASVAASAAIEAGSFLAAGAVVGPEARAGQGVIVNHNAVVDHDCEIGAWCHIGPGATLGGAVRIGAGVLVGAGAVLLPGIEVGAGAVIGAGAVVTRPVPAGETWVGIPAGRSHGA